MEPLTTKGRRFEPKSVVKPGNVEPPKSKNVPAQCCAKTSRAAAGCHD